MEHRTDRFYPSAPLDKNTGLGQGLEKKLNDVNSFNTHISNMKEMITYLKDKNHKSKKKYRNSNHNIRISSHNCFYWSNVNFYNSID